MFCLRKCVNLNLLFVCDCKGPRPTGHRHPSDASTKTRSFGARRFFAKDLSSRLNFPTKAAPDGDLVVKDQKEYRLQLQRVCTLPLGQ